MTPGYSTLGFTGRCCEILFQIKALGQSLGYLSTWTISPWGLWNFPVAGIARICTNGLCEDSSFRLIPAKGRLTLPQLRAGVKDISLISESYKAPVSLLLISSVLPQPLTSKFSYLLNSLWKRRWVCASLFCHLGSTPNMSSFPWSSATCWVCKIRKQKLFASFTVTEYRLSDIFLKLHIILLLELHFLKVLFLIK
jgi:hypothetical protein